MAATPDTNQQLRSLIKSDGQLELSLVLAPIPALASDEVLVRVEAAPINPSDLGLLFGPAEMSTARAAGTAERPVVTATVPEKLRPSVAGRLDQSLPVGNEGAGVVVAAGSDAAAQALLGRTVAILGGAMYARFRAARAAQCLVLPPGTTAAEGASCFVNPLTVLGMVETMRREGHTALVHTAAASNLGQMLLRVCLADRIPLVNVVRRPEQAALLRETGATWVCDSSRDTLTAELTDAVAATGATLGFDATGGGRLAGQLLQCMEAAASRNAKEYSRYGSSVKKQVYIYGGLDRGPTELVRNYGMAWGLGGWLLPLFLQKIGPAAAQQLRERVAAEVKTTFKSDYARRISLREALDPANIAVYGLQATGQKFLVTPQE